MREISKNLFRLELKTNGRLSQICYLGFLVCIEMQLTSLDHVLHDMYFNFYIRTQIMESWIMC